MDLTERGDGERRHPWEVQRFAAYRRILRDHGALTARRVLDIGAGDGWFIDMLGEHLPPDATTVCWDINYDDNDLEPTRPGLIRTRQRPDGPHDLMLALDVLEHISDADAFIANSLVPISERGTAVLVAVPAYQALFSAHDEALGHVRRYGRRELLEQLEPWIDVVEHGSLFTTLLLPRAATVTAERLRSRGDAPESHGVGGWSGGTVLTTSVNLALAGDAVGTRALGRLGVRLPGLSHWAFGRAR